MLDLHRERGIYSHDCHFDCAKDTFRSSYADILLAKRIRTPTRPATVPRDNWKTSLLYKRE